MMSQMNKKTIGTKSYVCVCVCMCIYIYIYIYEFHEINKNYLKKKKNEDIKIAITSYKQI